MRLAADDDAGLRAAEQLVAAEADEIDALLQRPPPASARARRRRRACVWTIAPLPRSSTNGTRFFRASAASSSVDGDSTKPSMKKLLRCTFRMSAVLTADRAGVVADGGLVGRADFAQPRAAGLENLGDPEAAADLHQLAARDDDLGVPPSPAEVSRISTRAAALLLTTVAASAPHRTASPCSR